MNKSSEAARGFTLLELLVAMAIFLIICGAMFGLLQLSQEKYSSETQMSGAFQEARLGIDQIVRDVDVAGYPSLNLFSKPASSTSYALSPAAWDPGYLSNTDCQIGTTCTPTPGDFDLIVETDLGNGVSWIRYQLVGTTLFRGVIPKTAGTDPVAATSASGVMVPLVVNVMNNAAGAQLAQITAQNPSMFSGGPQPVFQYSCNTSAGSQPCSSVPSYNAPRNISDIDVTLIVMTQQPDMQTQSLKLMGLSGRAHRSNPVN